MKPILLALMALCLCMPLGCATPLTPEEQKFVGTYKSEKFKFLLPSQFTLQKNRRAKGLEGIFNDLLWPSPLPKWKLVDEEIHTSGRIRVFIINPDGSLTAKTENRTYRRVTHPRD